MKKPELGSNMKLPPAPGLAGQGVHVTRAQVQGWPSVS